MAVILVGLLGALAAGAGGALLGARDHQSPREAPHPSTLASRGMLSKPTMLPSLTDSHRSVPYANAYNYPIVRQGWRGYTSRTYGYSIRYPEDWLLDESYEDPSSNRPPMFHQLALGKGGKGGYAYGGQSVILRVDPDTSTNEEYLRHFAADASVLTSLGRIRINGATAEKWSFDSPGETTEAYAFIFARHGKRYLIIKNGGKPGSDYDMVTEQVVSSFEFAEPASVKR